MEENKEALHSPKDTEQGRAVPGQVRTRARARAAAGSMRGRAVQDENRVNQ